jgi:hypothetical protein
MSESEIRIPKKTRKKSVEGHVCDTCLHDPVLRTVRIDMLEKKKELTPR